MCCNAIHVLLWASTRALSKYFSLFVAPVPVSVALPLHLLVVTLFFIPNIYFFRLYLGRLFCFHVFPLVSIRALPAFRHVPTSLTVPSLLSP